MKVLIFSINVVTSSELFFKIFGKCNETRLNKHQNLIVLHIFYHKIFGKVAPLLNLNSETYV